MRARPLFQPSCIRPARRKISFGSLPDDGVPLRKGSRLAALHAWLRPRVDQGMLLHGSKVLILISCFTLDWATLRCTLVASSFMSIAFHGLFPAPRPVRMAWGALFAAGHLFSLGRHLCETIEWELGDDESEKFFVEVFEPHGWTRWNMRTLLAQGEFVDVAPGECINEEAEPIDSFTILLSGRAEFLYRKDAEMGMPSHRFKQKDHAAWERQKTYSAGSFDGPRFCGEIWDRDYYTEATMRRLKEKWDRDEHLWCVPSRTRAAASACAVLTIAPLPVCALAGPLAASPRHSAAAFACQNAGCMTCSSKTTVCALRRWRCR